MKQKIIIFYGGQYSMPNEKTGEINSGTSISYYILTDLTPVDNPDGSKGMRSSKSSIDFKLMSKIKRAPAFYDGEFVMTADGKGKTVLKLVDVDYLCDFKIVEVPNSPEEEKKAR